MELNGKYLVELIYKGQYANTLYGKERYGELYVFATNKGKLATFDVVVKDDIKVYQRKEKQSHPTYDLQLTSDSIFDKMNLNTWQKVELERTFVSKGDLTIVQKNVISMVSKRAEAAAGDYVKVIVIDPERNFSIAIENALNPHHSIEGITLETHSTIKQIRVWSPDFSGKELYISEKSIQTVEGKKTIELVYKGDYGKKRYGKVYVYAANMGKIATFDVVIDQDIKIYLLKDRS